MSLRRNEEAKGTYKLKIFLRHFERYVCDGAKNIKDNPQFCYPTVVEVLVVVSKDGPYLKVV